MVKLGTHHIVNLALVCAFVGPMVQYNPLVIFLAYLPSAITDWAIDKFGHKFSPDGYMTRTMVTHSIVTAPIWGFSIGLALTWILRSWLIWLFGNEQILILAGVGASLVHLLLDSITANGIYFPVKRMSLSNFKSDSPALNAALGFSSLIQILMMPVILLLNPSSVLSTPMKMFFPDFSMPDAANLIPRVYPFFIPAMLTITVTACWMSCRGKPTIAWKDSHPQSTTMPKTAAQDLSLDQALERGTRPPTIPPQKECRCGKCGYVSQPWLHFCAICGAPLLNTQIGG